MAERHPVTIESYDRQIIEKYGLFLRGARNGKPVWHWSAYDAWWDRRHKGRYITKVAEAVGGAVLMFNPLTGDIWQREETP